MPYQNTLFLANLETLKGRRIKLSQSFLNKILSTNGCLPTFLPPECNDEVLSKLCKPLKYPELKNQKISAVPQLCPGPLPKQQMNKCFILVLCCKLCIV